VCSALGLVVEEIEDELTQITSTTPASSTATAKPGDLVETEQLDGDVFGRIGAQTAKQIVLQRIREVERDQVFDQFASREGELITGTVNRVEPRRSSSTSARTPRRSSPRPSRVPGALSDRARTSRRSCSRSGARSAARRSS
jgi:N utilization substance protein A